jgi:hypothetical protein
MQQIDVQYLAYGAWQVTVDGKPVYKSTSQDYARGVAQFLKQRANLQNAER